MWFIRKINKRICIINIFIFNSIFNNLNASEYFMEDDSNVVQHSSNRISLCSLESLGNYLTSFKNILSTCSCLFVKEMNLYQLAGSDEEENK
ncbi:MAG: hypothetical protein BGO77_08625 [Caedibacter sp. 37-49]|nr:MAG: hypothetical protein BGO77_08625 [Caedibacter sp. 37-49]